MEELNTNLTVQQTAAPESPLPQKPPVPLRDRVLAFALLALGYLGSTELLTPTNILLYQLIWAGPGLLVTEWTRVI